MPLESLKVLPVKSNVLHSLVNSVTVKDTLTVQGNPRRHSIILLGNSTYYLRFESFGAGNQTFNGESYPLIVLNYDEIGDVIYQGFTIVVVQNGSDSAVIETYTEERPVD